MKCYICGEVIKGMYCRFVCVGSSTLEFYTHYFDCSDKFHNNVNDIIDREKRINDRFEILDL